MIKKDNRGSSLVAVIICMSFLMLLSASVMGIAMMNIRMKQTQARIKENRYIAEQAFEELVLSLENLAYDEMAEIYTGELLAYTGIGAYEFNENMQRKFIGSYPEKVNYYIANDAEPQKVSELFQNVRYNSDNTYGVTFTGEAAAGYVEDEKYFVCIKDATVKYTDEYGYQAEVSADIKIYANGSATSGESSYSGNIDYADEYVVISGGSLNVSGSGYTADVAGNVYAESGINATKGGKIDISSEYVITRHSVAASDGGCLNMAGDAESGKKLNLWALNIATKNETEGISWKNSITIDGSSYIGDDMLLSADDSEVTLSGEYYGYRYTVDEEPISGSSATNESSSIGMNGSRCVLDMSGLSKLWIAGNAYLHVPDYFGSGASGIRQYRDFLQGEAIAYKGYQAAYLLPGECIPSIGYNPLTIDEYRSILEDPDNLLDGTIKQDMIVLSANSNKIDLLKYLKEPYVNVQVVTSQLISGSSEQMVYMYLNFKSVEAAADYFAEYYELYHEQLTKLAAGTEMSTVLLPEEECINVAANIFAYNAADNTITFRAAKDNGTDYRMMSSNANMMSRKFYGLINALDEEYYAGSSSASLITQLFSIKTKYEDIVCVEVGDDNVYCDVYICDDATDVKRIDGDVTGLIATAGDVILQSNSKFTGLIIAGGDVIIQGNAELDNGTFITGLAEQNKEVAKVFKKFNNQKTGADKPVTIVLENWSND